MVEDKTEKSIMAIMMVVIMATIMLQVVGGTEPAPPIPPPNGNGNGDGDPRPEPWTGTGFSLRLINVPSDVSTWVATFGDSLSTTIRTPDEVAWVTTTEAFVGTVKVYMMTAAWSCPVIDPNCAGLSFPNLELVPGENYTLDVNAGVLDVDPDPGPVPPPATTDDPVLLELPEHPHLNAGFPVGSGDDFYITGRVRLPLINGDHTSWAIFFDVLTPGLESINNQGFTRLGVESDANDGARGFISPEVISVVQMYDPELAATLRPLAVENIFDPILARAIHQWYEGAPVWQYHSNPLPPGSYAVKATAQYSYVAWYGPPMSGLGHSIPQGVFDLGIVGTLVVT